MIAIVNFSAGDAVFLGDALRGAGLDSRGAAGIDQAGRAETAVIFFDLASTEACGFIAELRARHPMTTQLAVTEQDSLELRLAAYDAGADDCLSRPFHPRELTAKLQALRRRGRSGSTIPLLAGHRAAVDLVAQNLRVDGKTKTLTKREADLLALLARAAGEPVRREDVLREAWGAAPGLSGNLVDVYVGYLRRKLKFLGASVAIGSVRGEGFQLIGARREGGA